MKRKYGRGAISAVLEFFEKTKKKYDELLNGELYEKDAEKKIRQIKPKLESLAGELTERRKKAASALKRTIETELKDLELSHTRFDCQIQKQDFSPTGADALEFMISLNPGESLLPLKKIVSAGEVSRIMLAMKKALMKVDPVLTLIFDEIDANIGGRLGEVTGQKLKEITSYEFAAMMIYKASSVIKVSPVRFYEGNEAAMKDIERCAAEEKELK